MPTNPVIDGSWKVGICPTHGQVPFRGNNRCPKQGCKYSLAEPWQMNREVPFAVMIKAFRNWMASITPEQRALVRQHFESEGSYPDTERAREFLEVLRKEY